jgi:uncharacterized protein YbjT (DUF2867 family)
MRIVINTPMGNIGSRVVAKLLQTHHQVVGLVRDAARASVLGGRGVETIIGSIDEPGAVRAACAQADALLWVTPPAYERPNFEDWIAEVARSAAKEAAAAGIRRTIIVSSAGAQAGPGAGPVGALRRVEETFLDALQDVIILRAAPFMENFLHHVATIASHGAIFSPLPAREPYPFVAIVDIADAATSLLCDPNARGSRIQGVHGPEAMDHVRAAAVISRALGRPVAYTEVSIEEAVASMRASGLPDHAVALLFQMYVAIRERRTATIERADDVIVGRTSLDEFTRSALAPIIVPQ